MSLIKSRFQIRSPIVPYPNISETVKMAEYKLLVNPIVSISCPVKNKFERWGERSDHRESSDRRERVRISMAANKPETLASARKKLSEGTRLLPEEKKADCYIALSH